MGCPVVRFEIAGTDGAALHRFYAELFDWRIDADNPMGYGLVSRDEKVNADGVGIGGGIGLFTDPHGHTFGDIKAGRP